MHLRLGKTTDRRRPRERPRDAYAPVEPALIPPPTPPLPAADRLADERRMRASGGPEDNATYRCGCGLIFQAPVSTGVACPSCGAGQAW